MAKLIKTQLKAKKKNSFFTSPGFLYLVGTVFIVFFVYSFSLFRPWLPFDERLIYKETFFPIPTRFEEISEIINSFILKSHILSMNSFFSNQTTLRSNPITFGLIVFVSFFFKKHAFLYHLLQLFIHLINTAMVYILLKKTISILARNQSVLNNNFINLTASLFTLLWGLHSANTEAVLLVTNWTALLTYTFCFCFLLYEISKIEKNIFSTSKNQTILISLLFLILMFLTEYGYTLPAIIFFMVIAYSIRNSKSIKESVVSATKVSMPYFIGLFLFFLLSVFKSGSAINNIIASQGKPSFAVSEFVERNLWFVPQIFIHFLKLLIFPKILSLYQSNLVHLSNNLITPYSIFCSLSYALFLFMPLILLFLFKKKIHGFIYPLIYVFYFSVFPFLHIITPTYCLSADRYCYFPYFILLFILIQPFYLLFSGKNQTILKPLFITASCFILIFGVRTLIRIQEWNDPYKLYSSAAKAEKNPLYKGQRLIILANYVGEKGSQIQMENFLQDSLKSLNKALEKFKHEKEQSPNQPLTLKLYGLDYKTLILKTAYSIATIKNDNYQEPPEQILDFLNPYFKDNLKIAGITQIILYSEILLKAGLLDKAKKVLEYGYRKFNYSDEILNTLAEYYMFYEKDLDKSFKILQHAYNLFPNNVQILDKFLKYYEQKNDPINQAKIAYLIGLRRHSPKHYQLSAKIYLDLNQLQLANKALRKSIRLNSEDPLTLLLTSRYLDLTGQRNKILGVLNTALILSNKLGNKQDLNVTKSILISLINLHANLGNISNAKQFLSVFETIKNLTPLDRLQVQSTKKLIEDIEKNGKVTKR